MKQWMKFLIAVCMAIVIILAGLYVANEMRRRHIIAQGEQTVSQAQAEIAEMQQLGFADRDSIMKSLHERIAGTEQFLSYAREKTWVLSLKLDENQSRRKKLERLIALNKKILRSYKLDLMDAYRFEHPDADQHVAFCRNKIAHTVVELAHLIRSHKHISGNMKKELSLKEHALLQQTIDLNNRMIADIKQEIKADLNEGLFFEDKKIQEKRIKLAAKMNENNVLFQKLDR